MSARNPRNLRPLASDAIRNGWGVVIIRPTGIDRRLIFRCTSPWVTVRIEWLPDGPDGAWRLWKSNINGEPTPYQQCARLIRSTTEGNP